jgi:hypothetical protein
MNELGNYQGKLVEVMLGEINDKPVLECTWQIEGSDQLEKSLHYFTGGAQKITVGMMKLMGWKGNDDLLSMIGVVMPIMVYEEEYKGALQRKVRVLTMSANPMSPTRAKSFLASLTSPSGPAFARDDDDDGLPF